MASCAYSTPARVRFERELSHENAVDQVSFMLDDTRILAQELVEAQHESDEFKTARLHLWEWRTGQLLSVTESRPRSFGSKSARLSSFSVAPGARIREIVSAEDGHVVGSLTTDWDIQSTRGFGDIVLVHLAELEPTELEYAGRQFRQQRVTAQKVDLWNPKTERRLTLLDVPNRDRGTITYTTTSARSGVRQVRRTSESIAPQVSRTLSPDRQLIALTVDSDVYIYSSETGKLVRHIQESELARAATENSQRSGIGAGFRSRLNRASFSPDSQTLMCELQQGVVFIAVDTGEILQRIRVSASTYGTATIQYSGDGAHIVALNAQGHPQVWNVASGQVATPPLEHDSTIRSFDFSGDGQYVQVVGESGSGAYLGCPHG